MRRRNPNFIYKNTSNKNETLKPPVRSSKKTQKNHTTILGFIDRSPRRHYFSLRPFQKDFDALILLKKDELQKNDVGLHAIVRVSLQKAKGGALEGTIIETFSSMDDRELELAIVQETHGFPTEFEESVIKDAERVRALKPGQRTDLTQTVTVTIDGETAKDFDDAISVSRLKNGNYNLKVSIADVSHYVQEGSALDQEAYARGTSIYFPGFAVPMLPETLSNDLCSLVPHQERLTLTCEMEVDHGARIVSSSIYPSVIKSAARLTYTTVSKVLEKDQRHLVEERIAKMLADAFELSKIVRANRYERGALDLDLPEVDIEVNQAGEVLGTVIAERNEAHKLIEDFMILANEAVSTAIERAGYDSIFRIHEEPDPVKIERLQLLLKRWGFSLSEKQDLVSSLQDFLNNVRGHPNEKILVVSLLRSMKQAQYAASNAGHFGLGSKSYTHFTSPIRRYPDLMIHRILRKSNFLKAPASPFDYDSLQEISTRCSETERRAFLAERSMEDLKKTRFLEPKVGETFEGIITSVKNFGFFVEIAPHAVDGLVGMRNLAADYWEVDELETCIRGRRSRKEFWLGDKVKVQLVSVDRLQRRIDFRFIGFTENGSRPKSSEPNLSHRSHDLDERPNRGFGRRRDNRGGKKFAGGRFDRDEPRGGGRRHRRGKKK